MAFVIEINGDSSNVDATIAKVGKGLDGVGERARDASGKFVAGMREGSASADKAKQSVDGLIDGLTRNQRAQQSLLETVAKRERLAEEQMYERIKGPLDQYTSALGALDRLLEKDKISTSEYAEQVLRLNTALEKMNSIKETNVKFGPDASQRGTPAGPMFGPDRNQAGPSGDTSGGGMLGAGGMIAGLASIAVFKQAASAVADLSDRYVEESNQALRLTDSTHSVNDVLREQISLGEQFKTSTSSMIDLTAKSRQAMQDMNLTSRDRIEIEKGVYDMVRLQGEGTEAASAFMVKFGFAAEEGGFKTKVFEGILREYPDLLHAMEAGTGKNVVELVAMQKAGVDMTKVMEPFLHETPAQLEKMQQVGESVSDTLGHIKDKIALDSSGDFKSWTTGAGMLKDGIESLHGPLESLGAFLISDTKDLDRMREQMADKQAIDIFVGGLKDAAEWLGKLDRQASEVQVDPFVKKWKDGFTKTEDSILGLKKVIVETSNDLAELQVDQAHGLNVTAQIALATDMHAKATRDLAAATKKVTEPMSEYGKLLESINKPMREHTEGLTAVAAITAQVDSRFAKGKLSAEQYANAISELSKAHEHYYAIVGEKDHDSNSTVNSLSPKLAAKFFGGDGAPQTRGVDQYAITGATLDRPETPDLQITNDAIKANDEIEKKAFAEREQRAKSLYDALREPAQKYADQLKELTSLEASGNLTAKQHADLVEHLKEKYLDVLDPEKKHADGLRQSLAEATAAGFGLKQLAEIEDDYRKKTGMARDSVLGFSDGLKSIEKEMGTGGATAAAKLMTDAFNGVNAALTELITTGTTDWSRFVKTLEADAVNFALKDLEGGLMGALKGGGQGASTAAAVAAGGATAATEIAAAITGAGSVVAAQFAAAMAGGFLPSATSGIAGIGGASDLGAAAAVTAVPSGPIGVGDSYHVPSSQGGQSIIVHVHTQSDPRALAEYMGGPQGAKVINEHINKNAKGIAALLKRH